MLCTSVLPYYPMLVVVVWSRVFGTIHLANIPQHVSFNTFVGNVTYVNAIAQVDFTSTIYFKKKHTQTI